MTFPGPFGKKARGFFLRKFSTHIILRFTGKSDIMRTVDFERKRRLLMVQRAFDNDKYLQMQSSHIRDRIAQFGGKLYL